MSFFPRVMQARMAGVICAAIGLPMVSLAAQAGPPTQDVTPDRPTVVATHGNQDVVSMAVRYSDLNLASTEGIATLNARVKRAVASVCGDVDPKDLVRSAGVRNCRVSAAADAVAQVALLTTPNHLAAR